MQSNYGRSNNIYGIILIIIIILLFGLTIFSSQFFTSENKLKIAFEKGQTLTFFTAVYNKSQNNEIEIANVIFFNTSTNRISSAYILPRTYISFGKHGYHTFKDIINKKINKEDMLKHIGRFINQKIDYYFLLEKNNFIRLIDMLGGVEIFSSEFSLPEHNIYFPTGNLILDGDKALEYLEVEQKNDNIYEKLKRHQNFMRGFLKLKDDFLENLNDDIISNHIYKLYQTNLSINDNLVIYHQIKDRLNSGIQDYSMNMINLILYCDEKKIENGYILLPKKNGDWIRREVKETLVNLEKKELLDFGSKIVIQILNGTDILGLAARTKRYLESYGIDVFEIGNTENNDSHEHMNTVIFWKNSEAKARKLAELIKCDNVIESDMELIKNIDVILILGKDFDGKVVKK